MSRIYWDTMLFVYMIEDHPRYASRVQEIFEKMRIRGDRLCTSAFTLAEILVGPRKRRAEAAIEYIHDFFRGPEIEVLSFTADAAETYAEIRADDRVSAADAIHLASAARYGTDLFLTNDQRLRGLVIPGIHFIAGMDAELL